MPYPNQHAARLTDPSQYKEFRTITPDGFPDGVSVVLGIKDDGKSEFQAIRADRAKMSAGEFKAFLKDKGFTVMKFEEATAKALTDVELFSTWLPLDLSKSDDAEPVRTKIGGIISTDTVDQQGDVLLQEGMDFSYFVSKGWFNYEHKQGAEFILGAPTKVEAVEIDGKRATRVEGYLLNDRPRAREIIDTANAIKRAGLPRTIGFSVEGQVLARDKDNPKLITRSKILNVAITSAPVNPDARLEVLARSLMAATPSKADVAAMIFDKHPELADDEVMSELHKIMNKGAGAVGYAEPAQPDEGADLSALTAESIDDQQSLQDVLFERMRIEMSNMMSERVTELQAAMKGERKAMPNISARQLSEVMNRVFPHLSQGQARTLATSLVSSVKTTYNN